MLLGIANTLIGFPQTGTLACTFQAILISFFLPASWIWTTFLVYQLKNAIFSRPMWPDIKNMHKICWLSCTVSALLPLTMIRYGEDDELSGRAPCLYSTGSDSELKLSWEDFNFLGVFMVCFVFIVYNLVQIVLHISKTGDLFAISVFSSLKVYPFGMFITWGPIVTYNVAYFCLDRNRNGMVVETLDTLSTQYGVVVSIAFFYLNPCIRQKWVTVFSKVLGREEESDMSEGLTTTFSKSSSDGRSSKQYHDVDTAVSNHRLSVLSSRCSEIAQKQLTDKASSCDLRLSSTFDRIGHENVNNATDIRLSQSSQVGFGIEPMVSRDIFEAEEL